ncbi:prepilin-type N-terminal cleavage/methylation domain-containing protein [Clostridium sp. YIM B02505]|uniref:Prepilin-type N-terminal cleavage/methylation domain-containing protein n=1 Tax=Clostridium yunnanense TaxID=2800325 RepID=A0ABS1ENQ0_9CLOT|nr:prepilin-type N-terminal cleavage/methylation domain-containing protein [Clostridium yunnanense]MBK1811011.1 prepilin-type N-terminal cleavage/methylation domain-containing protein [Clostridium yunnanense]
MYSNINNDGSYLFKHEHIKRTKGVTLIELMIYISILLIFISVFWISYKSLSNIYEDNYKDDLKKQVHSLVTFSTYSCKNMRSDGRIIFNRDEVIFKIGDSVKKQIDLRKGYAISFNTGTVDNVMLINNNGKIYTSGTITIQCPTGGNVSMSISVDNLYVKVKE